LEWLKRVLTKVIYNCGHTIASQSITPRQTLKAEYQGSDCIMTPCDCLFHIDINFVCKGETKTACLGTPKKCEKEPQFKFCKNEKV